ncbi:MAG: TatD family hydrolase [Bacteroidaceae bacterium]|nr:TatD family hydrolase [Bacteroidaceae bacterium]
MIDTHSHIYGPEFDEDRDLVVQRAREAGVEHILLPNINAGTIPPMLDLCRQYPDYCHPMMGLHPEDVREDWEQVLADMWHRLQSPGHPYVAVGEVGLDFYWDQTYRQEQLEAFEQQVCWARDLSLPLVIHSRAAHRELVDVMERHRADRLTGIFHCFGGTADEARELLSFEGFFLGIGGVLTYKKSALPDVLRHVPLQRIVLETDAPYLAPVPHRGRRNESAYVCDVLQGLAKVYDCAPSEVDKMTTKAAKRLFNLP